MTVCLLQDLSGQTKTFGPEKTDELGRSPLKQGPQERSGFQKTGGLNDPPGAEQEGQKKNQR